MENPKLNHTENKTNSIRLNDLEDLVKAINFINDLVDKYSIPDDIAYAVQLVVDEIYVNFCNYGKEAGSDYQDISFAVTENSIEVVFQDNGKEFNLVSHPTTDNLFTSIDERPTGGLGIYLVKHFADMLDYKHTDGLNTLTFKKEW